MISSCTSALRRTGYVWQELYGWHFAGMTPHERQHFQLRFIQPIAHVESPDTKQRIHSILEVSGIATHLVHLNPKPASREALLRFHTSEYLETIEHMSKEHGGDAGECAAFGPGGYEIALLSAGGVITALDAVIDGNIDNAYCLVRPPGHHAERNRGRGFCIFGNVAIAALHGLEAKGICLSF